MIASFLRSRYLTSSLETLRTNPSDPQALQKWRSAYVLPFTLAESVALFGLVLKFMGASWRVAGPFFAAAILLLLLWAPRLDGASQT